MNVFPLISVIIAVALPMAPTAINAATVAEAAYFITFNDEPIPSANFEYSDCGSSFQLDMMGVPLTVVIRWNNINWKSAEVRINPNGMGKSVHAMCKGACMETLFEGRVLTEIEQLNLSRMGLPVFGPSLDLPSPNDESRLWKAVDVLRAECPGVEASF